MADAPRISYPAAAVVADATLGLGVSGGAIYTTYSLDTDPTPPGEHRLQFAYAKFKNLVPNSLLFAWNGKTFYDRNGVLYHSFDPATGAGTIAGTIAYASHMATLTDWGGPFGDSALPVVLSMLLQDGRRSVAFVRFRTPGAPLRPGSLIVRATGLDGVMLTGTSDTSGKITGANVSGFVDFQNGIVEVNFGTEYLDSGPGPFPHRSYGFYSASLQYQRGGNTYVLQPRSVDPSTVLFNTVVYTAIPLDADLIGIDPVRLPTDGRVPIFKAGYVIVVHDTQYSQAPNNLISGQVISLARSGQTYVYVRDQNGLAVPSDRFAVDLAAGTVTIGNPVNLAGFVQPLVLEDRIEDMLLCTDVQITGELAVPFPIRHAYSAATALVSSALLFGDLQARYTDLFDQQTWANVWGDRVSGGGASSSFNDVDFPLAVINDGCITQRWAIVFTGSTTFNVLGEDVGLIATGTTGADLAPNNPATGHPYFTLSRFGWGLGWSAGNVLRFNTVGALAPIWFVRTTRAGDDVVPTDRFRIQARGDAT